MKIVSFNVNSVRKRLEHGHLAKLVDKHKPEIIGLQETKVQDSEFPQDDIIKLGYNVVFLGEPTHYGVALLVRQDLEMQDTLRGFPKEKKDLQSRFVQASIPLKQGKLHVLNAYFPNGENKSHEWKFPYKQRFYKSMTKHLETNFNNDDLLVVIGDMNISPRDEDIGIGEENRKRWLKTGKCSFLPEEREMLATMTNWGLEDSFLNRKQNNGEDYSWFDLRSRGFDQDPKRGLRIDLILATAKLNDKCTDAGIDYEIRGLPRASDHAPIWAEFDIS